MLLHDSLLKHCTGNFHEAGDIGTFDIVDITVRLSAIFHTSLVNVRHNAVEFLVNLCRALADVHCILSHFKT